jgi:hypothetical protein
VAGILLFSSAQFFSDSPQRQIGQVFLMVCTVCVVAHVFLWFASPAAIQQQIRSQMTIFRNRRKFSKVSAQVFLL